MNSDRNLASDDASDSDWESGSITSFSEKDIPSRRRGDPQLFQQSKRFNPPYLDLRLNPETYDLYSRLSLTQATPDMAEELSSSVPLVRTSEETRLSSPFSYNSKSRRNPFVHTNPQMVEDDVVKAQTHQTPIADDQTRGSSTLPRPRCEAPVEHQRPGKTRDVGTTEGPSTLRPNAQSHSTSLVASKDIMRFVALDRFATVIRQLYLPPQVTKWQQLVRAAVLVVGTLEEWDTGESGKLQPGRIHIRSYTDARHWVSEWLELQPLARFSGPTAQVEHPRMLLCPSRTAPRDWALFWLHARAIIFGVLLGLKSCWPYSDETGAATMNQDDWSAWRDDVLWVLHQLLAHMSAQGKSVVLAGVGVKAPSPLPSPQRASLLHSDLVTSSSSKPGSPLVVSSAPEETLRAHKKRSHEEDEDTQGSDSKRVKSLSREDAPALATICAASTANERTMVHTPRPPITEGKGAIVLSASKDPGEAV
ncbi:hypothetical protein C8Q76DRAFT_692469 [Earliella scabrosa]|nr:hypothetical protein C8Q76DRAFT_692469 [Earliella scabrosa]